MGLKNLITSTLFTFSIDNNISNSIEVFVLKSEFKAAFELTLKV